MKNVILITLFTTLLLMSCRRDVNSALDRKGNIVTTQFTKEVILPSNPCGFITADMITSRFDVQKIDLDFEDDYSKCGYSWKKINFEELRQLQINTIFDYAKKESGLPSGGEDSNTTLSEVIETISPYNTIQVGNFIKYESLQEAVDRFTLLHKVPTKAEMKRLQDEMKKQIAKENIDNVNLGAGNNLTLAISRNLKFKSIDGIGDQAYYDYLEKSLDVRYGAISFKLYIDSEKDLDINIKIAKELADVVWEKL